MSLGFVAHVVRGVQIEESHLWTETGQKWECSGGHLAKRRRGTYCPLCGSEFSQYPILTPTPALRAWMEDNESSDEEIISDVVNRDCTNFTDHLFWVDDKIVLGCQVATVTNYNYPGIIQIGEDPEELKSLLAHFGAGDKPVQTFLVVKC